MRGWLQHLLTSTHPAYNCASSSTNSRKLLSLTPLGTWGSAFAISLMHAKLQWWWGGKLNSHKLKYKTCLCYLHKRTMYLLEDLVLAWILMLPVPAVMVSLPVDMQSSHQRLLGSGVPANTKRKEKNYFNLIFSCRFCSFLSMQNRKRRGWQYFWIN